MKRARDPLNYIDGNLCTYPCDLIVQQCNCLTVKGHGLSATLATAFPESDIYAKRKPVKKGRNLADPDHYGKPGTCIITGKVAAILGQWKPGKCNAPYADAYPNYEGDKPETYQMRQEWFALGLEDLRRQLDPTKHNVIAFPHFIGCGLAGGSWPYYVVMLEKFAAQLPEGIRVDIVQLKK